jgi:hypothetical protein
MSAHASFRVARGRGDRIDANAQQSVLEVRAHFRGHDLAGQEVGGHVLNCGQRHCKISLKLCIWPPTLSGPGQEHEKCLLEFTHNAKRR